MKFLVLHATVFGICACLAGCGGRLSDEDRLKLLVPNAQTTFPVTGKVLVGGKPVPWLWITLHPKNPQPGALTPSGQTDSNGDFQITTYLDGDGAPAGDYKITVEWLHENIQGEWVGPSKLSGVCGNPKTTEFSVTVGGAPVNLPTFAVNARPDADTLTPRKSAN